MLEPDLLLDLLVTVFAIPLSERMLRAGTVELCVASRTPNYWGGEGFVAHLTIDHVITNKSMLNYLIKHKEK